MTSDQGIDGRSITEVLQAFYDQNITDEFIPLTRIHLGDRSRRWGDIL
ncbi:MAG UNVERIFIED_CONTAM: hypothetical protein LVR29_03630 [Microcystis novacekii LVE1205-3]|jgi:2,3-bisphosphoglycerate-independent phosphoglycerate mutase